MFNKKDIIIIISVAVIIIVGLSLYRINKKKNVVFYLSGEDRITIKYGEVYSDPGVVAKNYSGNDISQYVFTNGSVNSYKSGAYQITYELNYENINKKLSRVVVVSDMDIDNFDFIMNGEETVYVLKGNEYIDEGAYIVNKIDNSRIWDGLDTISNVDINNEGEYYVTYSFKHSGSVKELKRKVVVFDILTYINPSLPTNGDVEINIEVNNNDVIKKVVLPDGGVESSDLVKYKVNENGDYTFILYNSNDEEYVKTISVQNIIDSYSCVGEINYNETKLTVISPSINDVLKFEWNIDGETIDGKYTYSKNRIINNASVNLMFANGSYNVKCNIKDNLIYHFKYDEFFEKPEIACNSYTEQDRIILDAKLKSAINQVGKGTRAGLAEAARFIVGALDYKVRYLGPKKENYAVGRYPYVGLNIGKSDGWGCKVSGYKQGIDCTNFIDWVFTQNNMSISPFDDVNVSKSADVYSRIRAGDLMLSPCPTPDGCWGTKYRHVGIVIGVDEKYIYVAEATTDSIYALVATKWEKYNMPKDGKFSYVKFLNKNIPDGKYTDMWMR